MALIYCIIKQNLIESKAKKISLRVTLIIFTVPLKTGLLLFYLPMALLETKNRFKINRGVQNYKHGVFGKETAQKTVLNFGIEIKTCKRQ